MEAGELKKQMEQFETSVSLLKASLQKLKQTGTKNPKIQEEIKRLKKEEESLLNEMAALANHSFNLSFKIQKELLIKNARNKDQQTYLSQEEKNKCERLFKKVEGQSLEEDIYENFPKMSVAIKVMEHQYLGGFLDGSVIYFQFRNHQVSIQEFLSISDVAIEVLEPLEGDLYFAFDENQNGILFSKNDGVLTKLNKLSGTILSACMYHGYLFLANDQEECEVWQSSKDGYMKNQDLSLESMSILAMISDDTGVYAYTVQDEIWRLSIPYLKDGNEIYQYQFFARKDD